MKVSGTFIPDNVELISGTFFLDNRKGSANWVLHAEYALSSDDGIRLGPIKVPSGVGTKTSEALLNLVRAMEEEFADSVFASTTALPAEEPPL